MNLTKILLTIAFGGSYVLSPFASPTTASLSHKALSRAAEARVPGHGTEAITETNWRVPPKLVAIRKIVSAIDAGLKQGTLKISRRKFECGTGPLLRRIARDAEGVVTFYEVSAFGESGDASADNHYYYDHSGHLRFVLIIIYAVNGTRQQLRAYFDEKGKLLQQTHRLVKGPGYFFPTNVEGLVKQDPAREFASDAEEGCKEIKPLPRRRGQKA